MSSGTVKALLVMIAALEVNSVEQGSGNDNSGADSILSAQNVIISLSMLCMFILVAIGCTWGWWKSVNNTVY